MLRWTLPVLVFASVMSALLNAQAPVPKALKEAKTIFMVNDGASQGMMDDVAKELTKWGRFELVDNEATFRHHDHARWSAPFPRLAHDHHGFKR